MHFSELPEFQAQNPTDFEIEAVKILADQRHSDCQPTVEEALVLLSEVRRKQKEIEYETLVSLRKTTRSDPRGNPQVDRIYRWILLATAIGLIIYIYARMNGMR